MRAPLKFILGAFLLTFSTFAFPNAVTEFRRHVTDWEYQSSDQLGERCFIELFGSRDGGLRVDLQATAQLVFFLQPDTDYMASADLYIATVPALSDSGEAKTRLVVRNKKLSPLKESSSIVPEGSMCRV